MKKEATDQLADRELKRAVSRAFKRVEKMIREEAHQIIIESAEGDNSSSITNEVAEWLFHRRHNHDSSGN